MVRAELGPDAVILRTRQQPGPGWLARRGEVEIVASKAKAPLSEPPSDGGRLDPFHGRAIESRGREGPGRRDFYRRWLLGQHLPEEVASSIAARAADLLPDSADPDDPAARETFVGLLMEFLPVEPRLLGAKPKTRAAALVGPTGAGKTSMVAKLAARARLEQREQVGIVSVDRNKIGADAELRGVGEILGAPFEAVRGRRELDDLLEAWRGMDLILIDTPGLPLADSEAIEELADLFRPGVMRHLVLDLTAGREVLERRIDRFREVGFTGLMFTHWDEVERPDGILWAAQRARAPIRFVADGQAITGNLWSADRRRLAQRILEVRPRSSHAVLGADGSFRAVGKD